MKKIAFSFVFLTLVSFFSCQKPTSTPANNTLNSKNKMSSVDPSNSLNPYDNYGQDHNEGVIDYFDNFYDPEDENTYDMSYMLENYYGFSSELANTIAVFQDTNNLAIWEETGNYSMQIITIFEEHPKLANLHNNLLGIITGESSLYSKINDIKALEESIMNDESISESEMYTFLHASTVARYSAVLWTATELGGLGGGDNLYSQECSEEAAARGSTDKIILADFVSLWTVGLMTGWWSGPGPALVAAVSNSVVTAVTQ